MADSNGKFHPALAITNIKSLIPITLDHESGLYHSWAALFKVQVRVHNLLHHIEPPTAPSAKEKIDKIKSADPDLYSRLDAVVLQWMYGTVSPTLLQAILFDNDTAADAWKRLESLFQDQKGARATQLEEELADLDFDNFTSIDAYCTHTKSIADRLKDVDAPVPNSRLVLKLLRGLPEAYSGTCDYINNQDPIPPFESIRSRLALAERNIKARAKREAACSTVLIAGTNPGSGRPEKTSLLGQNKSGGGRAFNSSYSRNKNTGKGIKSPQTRRQYGGQNTGGGYFGGQQNHHHSWPRSFPPQWNTYSATSNSFWRNPPCPYPTQNGQPTHNSPRPGILGPRPQQAHLASYAPYHASSTIGYTPTDIEAAMHTLTLSPPDENFYMDTGATSHMTGDQDREPANEM